MYYYVYSVEGRDVIIFLSVVFLIYALHFKLQEHFFSLDKTERRLPVRLNLQIWDNDLLSADDFLGVYITCQIIIT